MNQISWKIGCLMKNNVMKVVVIKGNGRTWGMGSFDCPGELALENDKILGINTLAKITLKEVEISYGSPKRWRRKWQPSPVLLPRKSHGWRSLVSFAWQRVGHDWATSLSIFFFKPLGKFPKFLSGNTVCQGLYSPQHYKIFFFITWSVAFCNIIGIPVYFDIFSQLLVDVC